MLRKPGLALAAVITFAAAAAVHFAWIDRPLFDESPPSAAPADLLRAMLLASGSALSVLALRDGRVRLDRRDPGIALGWVSLFVGWLAALVFLVDPQAFYELAGEGRPVETASALVGISAALGYAWAALLLRRSSRARGLEVVGCCGLALSSFLIAMEEISWFQQLLHYELPTPFDDNLQKEANLHNFATNKVENLYYTGAFLFFVVAPFLAEALDRPRVARLGVLVPSRAAGWTYAFAAAFNYDMWNLPWIQLATFVTAGVLLHQASDRSTGVVPVLPIALAVGVVVVQALFLAGGERFVRPWDVTEYKELFIPLGMLAHALATVRGAQGGAPEGGSAV
jgi:hypothetical protein